MAVSKVDNGGELRAAWANATSSSGVELVWWVIAAAVVATRASSSILASGGCSGKSVSGSESSLVDWIDSGGSLLEAASTTCRLGAAN
jgi:hypothetical protein